MEINNVLKNLDPYVKAEQSDQVNAEKSRRRAELRRPDSGDRASVSPEAKLRAEGFSAALAAPEVRAERVDALKAKIAAGDYQIDARNIAEKMLKEDADLFE